MAIAFRHMGLGSPLQVMNFARQREHEIGEALRLWKYEHEMWTKVDLRPALPAKARVYLRARQRELTDAIAAAQLEQAILQELFAAFQPCPACDGSGVYMVQLAQDDIKSHPCETCNGSATRA